MCPQSLLIDTTLHFMNQMGSQSVQFMRVSRSDLAEPRTAMDWYSFS
jgi:hypothetical protein